MVARFRGLNGPLGGRTCYIAVGSAPVTPQLLQFLQRVWCKSRGGPAVVAHGYGSTECGTIAVDGRVSHDAFVILVERSDFNASLAGPRPRGELLVHTPQVVQQYTQGDRSGVVWGGRAYFRPGDICETEEQPKSR
eukprot:SAG22_NODE_337_length_12043_cov_58.339556_9_plen_136_part_00